MYDKVCGFMNLNFLLYIKKALSLLNKKPVYLSEYRN